MSPPVRGKHPKRKRDGSVPLQVMYCTPLQLWLWWNEMDTFDYDEIHKYLGFLMSIMKIKPKREVIDVLLTFWDPKNNVFHFSNFEFHKLKSL